jgi:hypothetical protein
MSVRLGDVPPEGVVIAADEYACDRQIYFQLLERRLLGLPYIEDGRVHPQVRVCQIEEGSTETCEVRVTKPVFVPK